MAQGLLFRRVPVLLISSMIGLVVVQSGGINT